MGNIDSIVPEFERRPAREDESSPDTDSDSDDGRPREDTSWRNMNLKSLGIQLKFSRKEDAETVLKNKIGKWSVEKRNQDWKNIPTEKGDFICSDIYEVEGPKIQTTDDVIVTVTLGKNLSPKRHKVMVKRSVDGKWETEGADLQTSLGKWCKAVFKTRQIAEFALFGCVKVAKVKVSPTGTKVKVDASSKMAVDIPAGAVDKDQDMDFRIIPPDSTAMTNYLNGANPFCKSVVGVTECLYGDSKTDLTFKKPVTVQLPVDKKSKEKETTLVLFRMVGNDVQMMASDTKFSLSPNGICNLEVTSFSGYCAATVRQEAVNDVKTMVNDVRLLYGMNSLAKILVFREQHIMTDARFPRVWVELIDKVHVNNVVKMRVEEGGLVELPNSRSADLKVKDNFKLKFELTGNIKGDRSIPKGFYLISYLEVSDDNHKIFPVELKDGGGRLGIINFYHDRDCVHSVQMDTQGFGQAVQSSFRRSSTASGSAEAGGDQLSMGSGFASLTSIGNDGSVGGAGLHRKNSVDSIGSATSLLSVSDQCKALSDSSLFIIANKMGPEDGVKLSVQLGMADVFDNISQSSHSHRQANFKLMKDWVKEQTNIDEALRTFTKGIKTAKLYKIEKALQKAVKNNTEVSERDIQ